MQEHFEPPTFSPGIPQRQLRTRYDLLTQAGKAGILPEAEWKALSSPEAKLLNDEDPVTLFDILDDVPVEPTWKEGKRFRCQDALCKGIMAEGERDQSGEIGPSMCFRALGCNEKTCG